MPSSRNLLLSLLACGSVAAIVIACGSDGDSTFQDPNANPGVFPEAGLGEGGPGTIQDVNDPFTLCTGGEPPKIGGTIECPDDKNKPGCGCNTVGEQADCWTGARINRKVGVCKDGRTTCIPKNENLNVWGPCEGQVLPQTNGKGEAACSCFSFGVWKINNTSPCLWSQDNNNYYAHSTTYVPATQGNTGCDGLTKAGEKPKTGVWSTDTLKVDCAGTFDLCFKIRAGKYESPNGSDCVLGEVCINAKYDKENVEQPLPDLPHWSGGDTEAARACAKKWEKDTPETESPGYGEMIVKGQTPRCESIDDGTGGDFVFHRVKYCARICRPGHTNYQPDHPECKDCQLKGTGEF